MKKKRKRGNAALRLFCLCLGRYDSEELQEILSFQWMLYLFHEPYEAEPLINFFETRFVAMSDKQVCALRRNHFEMSFRRIAGSEIMAG